MTSQKMITDKIETILSLFEGTITEREAALRHGVSEAEIQEWKAFYTAAVRHSMNADKKSSNSRPRGKNGARIAVIIGALIVFSVGGAIASPDAADLLSCTDNDYFFCFSPNTPAKASEVNHNFAKMGEWVENAVGPIDALSVDSTVAGVTSINGELIADSVDIDGAATVNGNLTANSGTTTLGTLNAGATNVAGDLTANVGTTTLSTLNAGTTTISGSLTVTGTIIAGGESVLRNVTACCQGSSGNCCPSGYAWVPTDLNQDAGGDYCYLCYQK